MPELLWVAAPPRAELRRELRASERALGLRVIAEDVLGEDDAIDLVALDPDGRVVLVLIADGDDRTLLTRALAQRAWLAPRLRDWQQLAPSLELRVDEPIRLLLLSPGFSRETAAAASAVAEAVELRAIRCVRDGTRTRVLLEPAAGPAGDPPAPAAPLADPEDEDPPAAEQRSAPRFRSGLCDEDFRLTRVERDEFGS